MTTLVCRQCGKAFEPPAKGPRPAFCSAACRVAAWRVENRASTPVGGPTDIPAVRRSPEPSEAGAVTRSGRRFDLRCPIEPAHGRLLDWPTDRWGFFCPDAAHGGNGHFFTTDEVHGVSPVSRPAVQADPAVSNADARALDPGRQSEAPVTGSSIVSPAVAAGHQSPRPTPSTAGAPEPGIHPAATQPTPAHARPAGDSGGGQLPLPLAAM